ncbi:hypothetical protein [Oceanirhabdus sp. W0125-5]|uniref:hypothetical protein n=1 Tax=Oceanirhabdus sp. W0125-5 TaxID=2999116 RepID=UPI0022F2FB0A|nr:hypothetical protein [Oceanirhabdus sp. W0125-5]WBW97447.1 hypothetical protein OW730_00905 [Oceanirhabdus sp. W0125-5]
MYSVFIILNKLCKLDDILKVFYDNGCGATTVNSEGLAHTLCSHNNSIPLFAGLRSLFQDDDPHNVTIMSVIEEEKKLRAIVDTLKPEFEKNRLGILFVTPVLESYGVHNKEYENY